jgi:hypothetical protein
MTTSVPHAPTAITTQVPMNPATEAQRSGVAE